MGDVYLEVITDRGTGEAPPPQTPPDQPGILPIRFSILCEGRANCTKSELTPLASCLSNEIEKKEVG